MEKEISLTCKFMKNNNLLEEKELNFNVQKTLGGYFSKSLKVLPTYIF